MFIIYKKDNVYEMKKKPIKIKRSIREEMLLIQNGEFCAMV